MSRLVNSAASRLRFPVRQEAHHDDGPLDPGWQPLPGRTALLVAERLDATPFVASTPAMQAGPAHPEGQGRLDALLARSADAADLNRTGFPGDFHDRFQAARVVASGR